MTSFFISPLSELVKDAITAFAENSHQTNQLLALISHDLIFYITPFTFAGERCHNSACRKLSPNKPVTGSDITRDHMTSFFISPLSELVKDATTALAENSHQTNQLLALTSLAAQLRISAAIQERTIQQMKNDMKQLRTSSEKVWKNETVCRHFIAMDWRSLSQDMARTWQCLAERGDEVAMS